GSLICIPETPKCSICPVKSLCLAFRKGDPSKLPVKSNGVRVKKIEMVVGILEKNGRLLIRRRPERGIWGGLWEIPGTIRAKEETLEDALKAEFKEALGLSAQIEKKENPFEHHFTHRDATIHPFRLTTAVNGRVKRSKHIRWATQKDLNKLSFPVPHQKILSSLVIARSVATKQSRPEIASLRSQ
ncbi:MAG: NUDIX domain-containing protein, partial [Candidatus Omnitrophica bacterium]|nr:NUDIX domain-containing protein [Candidatus Omnitrophota bacterium]